MTSSLYIATTRVHLLHLRAPPHPLRLRRNRPRDSPRLTMQLSHFAHLDSGPNAPQIKPPLQKTLENHGVFSWKLAGVGCCRRVVGGGLGSNKPVFRPRLMVGGVTVERESDTGNGRAGALLWKRSEGHRPASCDVTF